MATETIDHGSLFVHTNANPIFIRGGGIFLGDFSDRLTIWTNPLNYGFGIKHLDSISDFWLPSPRIYGLLIPDVDVTRDITFL